MCRFLVYKGSDQILLSKLITDPSHSILNQSFDSRLRLDTRRPHNGDGFGIGYYTDIKLGPGPCLFTSTIPAWNCINLERIASKTASSLIFAHVRATTEGSLSDDNCHPFSHGTLMWMHNGGLGAWKHIKRRLGESLLDKWYNKAQGSTDTEWAFALFLNILDAMGYDPSNPPADGFGPAVLRSALLKTIQQINQLIKEIPEQVVREQKVDCRSLLNFAVSDGHTVICSRYVSSKKDEAASLYYSSGTSWDDDTDGNYRMDRKDKGADVVLVASEPLTFERDNWVTVPTNSTITIHKQTVMVHPILDEYYNPSPDFKRSSTLVISKGLDTNEKIPTPKGVSPVGTPGFPSMINPHSPFPSPNSSNGIIVSSAADVRNIRSRTHHMPPDEDANLHYRHASTTVCSTDFGSPLMRMTRSIPRAFNGRRNSYSDNSENEIDASEDINSAPITVPDLTFAGETLVSDNPITPSNASTASPLPPLARRREYPRILLESSTLSPADDDDQNDDFVAEGVDEGFYSEDDEDEDDGGVSLVSAFV